MLHLIMQSFSSSIPFYLNISHQLLHHSPFQLSRIITTSQPRTKPLILLRILRILRQNLLLRRPNLPLLRLLKLAMAVKKITNNTLEIQGTLLHLGVHLSVDEDSGVEILLGVVAEVLVLGEDSLEHLVDGLEVLVAGVLVAVDFVFHGAVDG